MLAIMSLVMTSCSKNVLVPMQKSWADQLGATDQIQFYTDPNRKLVFWSPDYTPGSLAVKKGVIVGTGPVFDKLTVDAGTKSKTYKNGSKKISVKVKTNDPRTIPFVPVNPEEPNSFYMMDLAWEVQWVDETVVRFNPYCRCDETYYTGKKIQKSVLSNKIVLDSAGTPKVHTVEITKASYEGKESIDDSKPLEYVYLYVRFKDIAAILKNNSAPGVTYDGKDANYKKK